MLNQRFLVALAACSLVGSPLCHSHAQEIESRSYPVLSGVGLALNAKDGHIYVGKVLPQSPADKSGLITAGDRLVSIEVDGTEISLDGKTVGEACSATTSFPHRIASMKALPNESGCLNRNVTEIYCLQKSRSNFLDF